MHKNKKPFILLTFFLVIISILFLYEGILRISGRYNTYSEISQGNFEFEWGYERNTQLYNFTPNDTFEMDIGEASFEYITNTMGFREREIDQNDTIRKKVFVFGDSFTEGNGTQYDSSWVRILEGLVNESKPIYDFYVCGVSGFDPFYAYHYLKEELLIYNPSHVIVTINDSDIDEFIIRGGFARFQSDGTTKYKEPPKFITAYEYSHVVRAVVHECYDYDYYLIDWSNYEADVLNAIDSIKFCLSEINTLCKEQGISFLALAHPVPHKICNNNRSYISQLEIYENIPFVNMSEPLSRKFNEVEDCTVYHWKYDSHFNTKGYALYGQLVFEELKMKYAQFF
jgi:hypothetical protein